MIIIVLLHTFGKSEAASKKKNDCDVAHCSLVDLKYFEAAG